MNVEHAAILAAAAEPTPPGRLSAACDYESGDPVGAFEILVVGVAAVEVAFAGEGGSAVETTPVVDQQYLARLPRVEQCPIGIVEDATEIGVSIQHIVENVAAGAPVSDRNY